MGSVEVLRPQDPLQKRFNHRGGSFVNSGMKSKGNSTFNPNPKPSRGAGKTDRRKRSPQKSSNSSGTRSDGVSFSSSPPETKGGFVMGQVKILKRGDALSDTASLKEELGKIGEKVELSTTCRPGPETTPKKFNMADFYAGSACVSSPPPSSLPVPGFFKKKNILVENNDYATCDLRRLLRLDLS